MEATIFILYFLVITFFVTRIPFFTKTELGVWWLAFLFAAKIAAGLVYAWIYRQPAYYSIADTYRYFEMSKDETEMLFNDPWGFFKDLFTSHYAENSKVFSGQNSYWNDLKTNLIVKILAFCNVVTLKNYNADMVIFNFFSFFGPVALYRMCREKFHTHKLILIASVFFIPSFIFWCSGLHKDGLLFSCLALITFSFNRMLEKRKIDFVYSLLFIFCMLLIFALRNFLAVMLLPALFVWYLTKFYPEKKWVWVSAVYGGCTILLFILSYISPSLNFIGYIAEKQKEFMALTGNSQLNVPPLQPTLGGFISYLPYAVDIAFLRPHFSETQNPAYLPAIAENFIFLCFFIFLGIHTYRGKSKRGSKKISSSSFVIFCFCFALSSLLLTGYMVTLTGAIVRYRALLLPFIFAPLCSAIKVPKKMKHIH